MSMGPMGSTGQEGAARHVIGVPVREVRVCDRRQPLPSRADYSLAIKAGVHFTLCGGTIAKLGTKTQHDKYFDKLDSLELPGCFGMTELVRPAAPPN